MLLAITPNPTIDRTLHVSALRVGEVHRASQVNLAAGGKGLNVTRAALTLGCEVLATGHLAGHAGRIVADLARQEEIPADWHWLASGETRTCLLINHANHDATVINEPGSPLSGHDWQGIAAHIEQLGQRASAVTFSGSLPPGIEAAAFATLAQSLVGPKRPVYVDTSGVALSAVLPAPQGLCLKVNQAELAAGLGQALVTREQIAQAGQTLLARGAALVVVTMGGQGAMAISPTGCWWAQAPPIQVVSTVGSGNSFLAGLAVAQMQANSVEQALRLGIACGTANALTDLPARFERAAVEGLLNQVKCQRIG